ncbi:MAG TPA: M14 family zinc carboxypeptidase [Kofleriaceae bacterium]|nr:M14 family zinc carboxypeptidase [Kofleriaceae bacterium]
MIAAAGCNQPTGDQGDPGEPEGQATAGSEALEATGAGPWAVRVTFADRAALAVLAADYAPWEVNHKERVAIIEVGSREELARLTSAGYGVEIDLALTATLQAPPRQPGVAAIPGYPCYRTVEETYNTAAAIATNFPNLATWTDIGDSWVKQSGVGPGYDIRVLRLTNRSITGPKPVMFAMGAIHAREYVTAETLTRFAEYLVNNYNTNADVTWLLDHHDFHFVLQANPDGRKFAETGNSWRKNTNQAYCGSTSTSRGADLNRNYPFLWGGGGSSGSACSLTYRGPTPTSEPETQAITTYVRSIFPDQRDEGAGLNAPAPANATGLFFDLHSYSELVMWPWSFGSNVAPNNTALRTLGRKLAFFNSYTPMQSIELYPADGVTIDFSYGELGVASYVFEMGTSFFQTCSTFESTIYPTNLQALLYAAKVPRTPYLTPAGPDSLGTTLSAATVPRGASVTLTAALNDTRFNGSNGAEPVQSVAGGEVYVDVPPWAPGATPLPMAAVDGSFNQTIETARATINTGAMTVGRHTLYVRGRDSLGNWGSVSAAFLTVQAAANAAPAVTITQPRKGSSVVAGSLVTLLGSATDPEDGTISHKLVWTSNLAGQIALGASGTAFLMGGVHQITATVTDSQGASSSASVSISVGGITSIP